MKIIKTLSDLEAIYGEAAETSLAKVVRKVTPEYRRPRPAWPARAAKSM